MSIADGEYIWQPKTRTFGGVSKLNDKDLLMWLCLAAFLIYFGIKAVPDIISHHQSGQASSLLSLKAGDTLTAELLAEIQTLAARRR